MADEIVAALEVAKDEPVVEATKQEEKPAETPRVYTQEELDRIVAKSKKNARYQTRKEIEAYYKGREESQPKIEPKKEEVPARDSFNSYEEYLEAKADYIGRKAAREERDRLEKENKEKQASEELTKKSEAFRERAKEKYPDLDERLEDIADIQMSQSVLQAIAESDFGPDILSNLADNPKECERIAALSPSAAIREIDKLEARFETAKPEPKKTVSKAPAPINPGGGTGSPTDDNPSDSDSIEEWMRKERARGRKKTST